MSENISLSELLNVSIGDPRGGTVNFSALHTLLLAMLKHLDLREVNIRWLDAPPGDPPLEISAPSPEQQRDLEEQQQHRAEKLMAGSEQEVPPGTELQERTASPPAPTPAGSGFSPAETRVQNCEDGVRQVMKTIEELHDEKNNLKEEIKELRQQQQMVGEAAAAMDRCCHRLDALEEAMRSLRASIQKSPEDLSRFVTWDAIQLGLLTDQELVLPGVTDGSTVAQPAEDPNRTTITAPSQSSSSSSITQPTDPTAEPATIPDQTSTQQADPQSRGSGGSAATGSSGSAAGGSADSSSAAGSASGSADGSAAAEPLLPKTSSSERDQEAVNVSETPSDPTVSHPQSKTEPTAGSGSSDSTTAAGSAAADSSGSTTAAGSAVAVGPTAAGSSGPTSPAGSAAGSSGPAAYSSGASGSPGVAGSFDSAGSAGPAAFPPPRNTGSGRYLETVEALRNIGRLKEKFDQLEVRVLALEKGKVDQSQLTRLRENLANTGSREASTHLMQQVNQQRALIDSLLSDREKLGELEDMILNLKRPDTEPSSEPGSVDSDRRCQELSQQVSFLRRSVQKLEADVKQLKVKQVQSEEKPADQHLQDQLDDLRSLLDEVMLNEMKDHEDQSESSTSRKLRPHFKVNSQLQDAENETIQQQSEDRTETQNVQLLNDVQKSILQLQTDGEKLQEITDSLWEDSRQKQNHIEKLFRMTEQLEVKKADKQMVETEIKADKCVLDTKVSRLQLDLVREQLTSMFHELLNKVTDQEQDWSKVMERLSTEMECKLNRIELDSVKKQLEDLWKNIQEKLQAQEAPEHQDAAVIRKQLVDRFHCLSCDRPIVKHVPGPHLVTLPSSPAFPSHKSMRPFTVYTMEQLRQQYRSFKPGTNRSIFEHSNSVRRRQAENLESQNQNQNQNPAEDQHDRISELTDLGHLVVSRSCGGSHTNTWTNQRRGNLQHLKYHGPIEGEAVIQSEEVDIVGQDGHVYKGRQNVSTSRNTETKLPTISTKDASLKTKDKTRNSPSHKPAASPESHQPVSARTNQGSRSASSMSGRDWPVSALGCASQSSSEAVGL